MKRMPSRFFVLPHCLGNRRILCGEKLGRIIEFTNIFSVSMKKLYELTCCQRKKVVLIDKTLNLCPFVFCPTFCATYCKINAPQNIVILLDRTKTKPSELRKGDCIFYVTPLEDYYVIDTVFVIKEVLSFSKAKHKACEQAKKYHYDSKAQDSHGWKDTSKKISLQADPDRSFIPLITFPKIEELSKLLKKVLPRNFKELIEIDFCRGKYIYKRLREDHIKYLNATEILFSYLRRELNLSKLRKKKIFNVWGEV